MRLNITAAKASKGVHPDWTRQVTSKSSGYESPLKSKSIWTDKVKRTERQPVVKLKGQLDLLGNRLLAGLKDPLMRARQVVQRCTVVNPEFAKQWAALSPREANLFIQHVANGSVEVPVMDTGE